MFDFPFKLVGVLRRIEGFVHTYVLTYIHTCIQKKVVPALIKRFIQQPYRIERERIPL